LFSFGRGSGKNKRRKKKKKPREKRRSFEDAAEVFEGWVVLVDWKANAAANLRIAELGVLLSGASQFRVLGFLLGPNNYCEDGMCLVTDRFEEESFG
jgi:hypothetical protein